MSLRNDVDAPFYENHTVADEIEATDSIGSHLADLSANLRLTRPILPTSRPIGLLIR